MNNEIKKNVTYGIIVFLFVLFVSALTVASVYKTGFEKTQSELGQLRKELESGNDRESKLAEQSDRVRILTGEAVEYVSRERDLLLTTGNTIKEIRKQVEDLERYCDNLEWYIIAINDYSNSN